MELFCLRNNEISIKVGFYLRKKKTIFCLCEIKANFQIENPKQYF